MTGHSSTLRVGLTRTLGFSVLPYPASSSGQVCPSLSSESSQGSRRSGESSTESEQCSEECQGALRVFLWKSFTLVWPSCCFLSVKDWCAGILPGPPNYVVFQPAKNTMQPERRNCTCRPGLKIMLWKAASHNFLQHLEVRQQCDL